MNVPRDLKKHALQVKSLSIELPLDLFIERIIHPEKQHLILRRSPININIIEALSREKYGTSCHKKIFITHYKEGLAFYPPNIYQIHSLFYSVQRSIFYIQVSPVSFIHSLGEKMKEGYCQKRVGGYSTEGCCSGRNNTTFKFCEVIHNR
ncbi:unnamed protein product, partial [Meganyctiphanes norvegica]